MSRAIASRSSRSRSYSTTSAPKALVRSRLASGASAGITMVARMLRICAAAATPWAWLPEENATTPPPRASGGIDDSLLKAPRNLNDPVRCSTSGLTKTFARRRSLSTGGDNNGVRTANGAIARAAASISAWPTGRRGVSHIKRPLYRPPGWPTRWLAEKVCLFGRKTHRAGFHREAANVGHILDESPRRGVPAVAWGKFCPFLRGDPQRRKRRPVGDRFPPRKQARSRAHRGVRSPERLQP